ESHSCRIEDDESVRCWGRNGSGELGTGQTGSPQAQPQLVLGLDPVVQLAANNLAVCALTTLDEVYCWGGNGTGNIPGGATPFTLTPTKINLPPVTRIASGPTHVC